jgi:NodT family efflux transporter outer membrane factor (OMF) lipoprotein
MRTHFIPAVLLLALAACKVGPDYEPPQMDLPDQFSADLGAQGNIADLADWWTKLGDPALEELIHRGAVQNLDVRTALARIDEARARYGITRADLFPTVDANGAATWTRISKNAPGIGGLGGETFDQYDLGIGVGWEPDVFGRVRRSIEAAGAAYQATVEDMRAIRMSLAAEIAVTYVNLRSLQERTAIALENVATQSDSLGLATSRRDLGLAPELDVTQAQATLATTQAVIPLLRDGASRTLHRLALLLGETPGPVESILGDRPVPAMPASVALGAPAELVRRRPDVRAAERRVAFETALVGVETADLYPSFSITGAFGLTSDSIGNLLDVDSRRFTIGPSFRWDLLDFGRIESRIHAQDARVAQAVAGWETSVLNALQEVEDSISGVANLTERRDTLERADQAAQRSVSLAKDLYRGGLRDFESVLEAQRTLILVQDQHASAKAAVVLEMIGLYKALGGGWSLDETYPVAPHAADPQPEPAGPRPAGD